MKKLPDELKKAIDALISWRFPPISDTRQTCENNARIALEEEIIKYGEQQAANARMENL